MAMLFKELEEQQPRKKGEGKKASKKEGPSVDSVSELKNKLGLVIEKVKSLKEEKAKLEARVEELEELLREKEQELIAESTDKLNIREQITDLLNELDAIEAG